MTQASLSPEAGISSGAGFWIRALARLIDGAYGVVLGFVSGVFGGIILMILQIAGAAAPGWQHRVQGMSFTGFGVSLLGFVLYHSFSEGIHGASLGKLICGLRVVTDNGRASNLKGSFIRSLAYLWDALFFGLVGYSSMRKSPLKKRYGDAWGRTVVVRTKCLPSGSRRSAIHFLGGFVLGSAAWSLPVTLALILKAL